MNKCDLCNENLVSSQTKGLCKICRDDPFRLMLNEVYATIGLSGITIREIQELREKANLMPEVRAFLNNLLRNKIALRHESTRLAFVEEAKSLLAKLPEVDK